MPSCSFRKCKNTSRNSNKQMGVTFHTFPQDVSMRNIWTKNVQQETRDDDWIPNKYSRICSAHFAENDFYFTPTGRRKVKISAVPTFMPDSRLRDERPGSPLDDIHISDNDSIFDTPRKVKLKSRLNRVLNKSKHYRNELKKLRRQNKNLKSVNINLKEIIKSFKKKKYLNEENSQDLYNNAERADMEIKMLLNTKRNRKISPCLRKFAMSLHYYSPSAYRFVRAKFNNVLPHTRTISKWYENRDANPGFTSEVFEMLKQKTANKKILCTLIVDEMAIRRQAIWTGRKTIGLVDTGFNTKEEMATEAYVFMIVSSTENWKVPVGYFLINGLAADQRAKLITLCIKKCFDIGVDIIALTFDGCAANIATAQLLGCSFDNINSLVSTFPHPSCNKKIALILDPSHMLKLVRNSFESKRVLFDGQNKKIEWKYLVKLQKLQESEGLKFANKLTERHINFRNQIMKVKLASQLFSRSVARSLELCSDLLTNWQLNYVSGTIEFLDIFNILFDIFNSRLYQQDYKRSLSPDNSKLIFEFLSKAEAYIKGLCIYNKICSSKQRKIKITINKMSVLNAKCKTGFLGFLININSLKFLYNDLIEKTHQMSYLSTYRFSQDHLELFFSKMRQHGGHNNNPNAQQFKGIYKKILSHLELRSSFTGNCLPLDNFPILNCSSALSATQNINKSCPGYKDDDIDISDIAVNTQYDINCSILAETFDKKNVITDISVQVVGYISGWVSRKIIKKINCETCIDSLMAKEKLLFHRLIDLKNMRGLIFPSEDVFNVCKKAELEIRLYMKEKGHGYFTNEKDFKVLKINILRLFLNSRVFEVLHKHSLEQPATFNHRILLIKIIIDTYINVRLHYIHKNTQSTKRQKFNKLVLFEGK